MLGVRPYNWTPIPTATPTAWIGCVHLPTPQRQSLKLRLTIDAFRYVRLRVTYESAGNLPLRWPAATLAAVVLGWVVLLLLPAKPISSPYTQLTSATFSAPEVPRPWPQSVALTAQRIVHERFASGNTLDGELRRAGVSANTAAAVGRAAAGSINLRRIRPGQEYYLYFDEHEDLAAMRYQVDRQTAWFVAHENQVWTTSQVVIPVQARPAFVTAEIANNLHSALAHNAPPGRSINDLLLKIGDLYGWDVDFNYDLRAGDRLDLIVEERFVEGQFLGYGQVLASEFKVGGRTLPVVRYLDADGASQYYTPEGASLRRAFLRSPVRFTRISSRFSRRRVHPVTGVLRAHRGVDYVADPGTEIVATADGVVLEATYGRESGRYVKIRHGGSYSSVYMHMSRIHDGVKRGVEVKQGQTIGYVGKSGNATGYHLHYGLEQGDRYVDPVRLQLPAADPIPPANWDGFAEQRDRWLQRLRAGQVARTSVVAGGP